MYKNIKKFLGVFIALIMVISIAACSSESAKIEFPAEIETLKEFSEKHNLDWDIKKLGTNDSEKPTERHFDLVKSVAPIERIGSITTLENEEGRFATVMINGIIMLSEEQKSKHLEWEGPYALVEEDRQGDVFAFISDLYGVPQYADKIYEEYQYKNVEFMKTLAERNRDETIKLAYLREVDDIYYYISSLKYGESMSTGEDGVEDRYFTERKGNLYVSIMDKEYYNNNFKERLEKNLELLGLEDVEIVTGDF